MLRQYYHKIEIIARRWFDAVHITTSCRGETSKTHLSPASPIVVYLLCADKCDRSLQSCLGLTFPLCCFDHIACWFPRNTRLCTKNRVIKITPSSMSSIRP